jgi:hypothetical protein
VISVEVISALQCPKIEVGVGGGVGIGVDIYLYMARHDGRRHSTMQHELAATRMHCLYKYLYIARRDGRRHSTKQSAFATTHLLRLYTYISVVSLVSLILYVPV